MDIRVVVLCCTGFGLEAVATLVNRGHSLSALVGLRKPAERRAVSDWVDIADFSRKHGIPHVVVTDYALRDSEDQEKIKLLRADLIWVAGWQRLIPPWLIDGTPLGAVGAHGSPDGITLGRGRSPQNWAILLAANVFELSLFRISPGMDDGPVISTKSFELHPWDDIRTSYRKSALAVGDMFADLLAEPERLARAREQEGCAFYYPQRLPDDGFVDWSMSQEDIWALCRAITHPYPGMRSRTVEGFDLTVWRCQPFDYTATHGDPGEIEHVFVDGCMLVQCGDGRLLIDEYECSNSSWQPIVGSRLLGRAWDATMSEVLKRHQEKHPSLPISPRIQALQKGLG